MKLMHRNSAIVLRQRGNSLAEIAERFDISKSTASLWTKDVVVSDFGRERIKANAIWNSSKGSEILKEKKKGRLHKAEVESDKLIEDLKKDQYLALSVLSVLYQCEGAKKDGQIRFTNSDPDVVKLFLSTLREAFAINENKLKVRVHIHDYHNDTDMKKFWSHVTQIPLEQFYASFKKPSEHVYKKEGYKGCVHISYYDSHITRVILSFAKKLINLYI